MWHSLTQTERWSKATGGTAGSTSSSLMSVCIARVVCKTESSCGKRWAKQSSTPSGCVAHARAASRSAPRDAAGVDGGAVSYFQCVNISPLSSCLLMSAA
eukprot:6148216-Pleurochrysis_carterae.AAC.1